MVAFAGWVPVTNSNWFTNPGIQKQIPFLQLAGVDDSSFCPLSYASFNTNLQTQIYTSSNQSYIKFVTVPSVGHSVVAPTITNYINSMNTGLTYLNTLTNSANNCSIAKAVDTTKTVKVDAVGS